MEMISWRQKNNPRSNSSKPSNVGGAIVICKKHPKHQQSPGVCSICLSEKLSLLSKPSRNIIKKKKMMIKPRRVSAASHDYDEEESSCSSSSYSPSQCSSCASSSACSSPFYDPHHHHHRLMKSRSLAAAVITARRRIIRERIISEGTNDSHVTKEKEKEKKSKFWSKLLIRRRGPAPSGKKIEEAAGLVHSRTMREMPSAAAH